jgi:hypothetical protein
MIERKDSIQGLDQILEIKNIKEKEAIVVKNQEEVLQDQTQEIEGEKILIKKEEITMNKEKESYLFN